MKMMQRLKAIQALLDTLGKDYPEETQTCLNFMQKAEAVRRST